MDQWGLRLLLSLPLLLHSMRPGFCQRTADGEPRVPRRARPLRWPAVGVPAAAAGPAGCNASPAQPPAACSPHQARRPPSSTHVPPHAVAALLAQRDAISNFGEFAAANVLTGWQEGVPLCSWTGVVCNEAGTGVAQM